jgi:ABC-type glycerol-3-phosphate transport system substrate-binding protein
MFGTQHRRSVVLSTAAMIGAGALLLGGCSSDGGGSTADGDPYAEPNSADGPYGNFEGQELTLERWAGDPWTAGQQEAASAWNQATGGKLTIDAIPYENLHDKQALALGSGSDFDIVYVHPSWFGEYASAGYLAPIDEYLGDGARNPAGFSAESYLPSVLEQGKYDGVQYCVQDFVSTIVVAYRTDLFEAAGIAAPETVDDVLAAAAQLDGVDGISGIVMPAKRTGAVSDIVGSLLTAQDNWWYDADGKASLDDDAAETAIDFYVEAAKYAPEGVLDMAVDEAATAAAQGQAAIVVDTTPALATLENPEKSATVGRWTYVPLAYDAANPSGELIYWNWCIAAKSEHKDAAYSFLQYYTSAAQQAKVAVAANTLGATEDFYTNEEVLAKLPFLPAVNAALQNANPQPSLADWPKIQDAIETAVQDAMTGSKTSAEAAAAMQDALSILK